MKPSKTFTHFGHALIQSDLQFRMQLRAKGLAQKPRSGSLVVLGFELNLLITSSEPDYSPVLLVIPH